MSRRNIATYLISVPAKATKKETRQTRHEGQKNIGRGKQESRREGMQETKRVGLTWVFVMFLGTPPRQENRANGKGRIEIFD